MSVLYWLGLVVVALAASFAAAMTLSAWRLRKATPRTLSLALSLGSCVAFLVTAAEATLTLPARWCTYDVSATQPGLLGERIHAALDRWTWMLWPCGRLAVEVAPADLEAPIALGELVEQAAGARITVDVSLPEGTPLSGQQITLDLNDRSIAVPTTTPIPLSYTDKVTLRLAGTLGPIECQIDDRSSRERVLLAELLGSPPRHPDDASPTDVPALGFHRLRCWPRGQHLAASTAYVHLVKAGVVLASSERPLIEHFKRCRIGSERDPAACIGLELTRAAPFALQVPLVVDEEQLPPAASMLVLDRPKAPASCKRAEELLARGATVVVAMPDERFFDSDCTRWFPVAPKQAAEHLVFDRTPRLTFVFDAEFEAGLSWRPSVVVDDRCEGASWPAQQLDPVLSGEHQREEARRLCQSASTFLPAEQCDRRRFEPLINAVPGTRVREFSRSPDTGGPSPWCKGSEECERLEHSDPLGAVSEVATALAAEREAWENELVVVFTHDHRPSDGLEQMRNFASRILVVPIDDPYGLSLSNVFLDNPREYPKPSLPDVLDSKNLRQIRIVAPRQGEMQECSKRGVPRLHVDFDGLFAGASQTRSRFSLADDTTTRFPRAPRGAGRADLDAPNRFGWWERPTGKESLDRAIVELATTTTDGGLVERPLMLGAMVGRGHLLFLGFSPFKKDPTLTEVIDREVLNGLRPIIDIYTATEGFAGEVHGEILSVEPKIDGALWITVARDSDLGKIDQDLHALTLAWSGGRIVAPLVDFARERRTLTYAVPAAELERLGRCEPLTLSDARGEPPPPPVFACPPDITAPGGRLMEAVDALSQLAFYTGGRLTRGGLPKDDSELSVTLHTRTLGIGALSLLFLAAWGRRAVRRLAGRLADRRLRQSIQMAHRRYDPPDAVVAAAGDWDGRATTWPRTGAFGGYRAIEPGDRASAAVLSDLLVRQLGGRQVLPRVALRVEEAAPSVLVLVNLGASMRARQGSAADKARFAGRVGLHIAASAWRIGGEVAIHAIGIKGHSELVEAVRLSPGHEEFEHNLRARLEQDSASDLTPWPKELSECGAVVYVSDFQLEDERALQAWLTEVEGTGIRVAGVMVYSPHEFTMVEGGRLAGSGIWADRTDWDPDDVFSAFSRRRDQIERIFDAVTTGGLVVTATTFHQDDIELALAGGRLLQILR